MDDTADAGQALAPGLRWEDGKMVHRPELVEEDRGTPSDLRTMREFVKLGSSVNPDVQLTGDCPSNHLSGKMPALDTQIWVENRQIRFEHYRKPMSNPLVMMECSAMPTKVKRTTLTQEVVRILRNISKELPKETANKHLSEFSSRMMASEYTEKFRLEVIKAGVEGFEKMIKVEEAGGRPVNRPRTWETDRRQEKKQLKKRNWFSSGGHHVPLFIPHTPNSQLAKLIRAKEEQNNQGRKIRFLICEVGGTKIHNLN